MPRISIDNYDTVATWNGDSDLFIVEQPDGTKVATPNQIKSFVLGTVDEVPTQNSNNLVKSGGIFSTMAVPKYNSATETEYFEGGSAFEGNIDSTPTAGSNNAVASGGTKTYVDSVVAANSFANSVQTKTVTGTTNTYADISLDLSSSYLVLSVAELTNSGGCFAIPRKVAAGNWYACVYRQNTKLASTSVTLEVKYVQI